MKNIGKKDKWTFLASYWKTRSKLPCMSKRLRGWASGPRNMYRCFKIWQIGENRTIYGYFSSNISITKMRKYFVSETHVILSTMIAVVTLLFTWRRFPSFSCQMRISVSVRWRRVLTDSESVNKKVPLCCSVPWEGSPILTCSALPDLVYRPRKDLGPVTWERTWDWVPPWGVNRRTSVKTVDLPSPSFRCGR